MITEELPGAMDSGDEVVTAPVAAALKGVHRNSVHKAIKAGRLRATRSGKSWLIRRGDLDAWQVVGHRPQGKANGPAPAERPRSKRERAEKAIQLLDEWMTDGSGHDEEYWPKIKAVLEENRLSSATPAAAIAMKLTRCGRAWRLISHLLRTTSCCPYHRC